VFLMSDAFRALDDRILSGCDWKGVSILLVSYEWGPAEGPEALAARRLVARLLESGARLHVLTAAGSDHELRSPNYEITVVPSMPLSMHKVRRTLQMVRCGIPEPAGLWVRRAVHVGVQTLASLPADTIIYGRAMPGSCNIVAWYLARSTGLPWVAHFSDPWPRQILSNRFNWFAGYKWPLYQFWRRRILEDAGALTFTNPSEMLAVLGLGRERYRAKAFVVTHLPSTPGRKYSQPQYDVFHIVHTGSFYSLSGHTSATLMQGVRLFLDRTPAARGRVRFTQAGWAHGDLGEWTVRCGLHEVVRNVGRLTQEEVAALLDTGSLLIAVDYARPDSTALLSKLPDYISAGRPILAITARSSAMGRLFTEDGVGLTAHYDSPEEVADRIGAVFEAWRQHRSEAFLPSLRAIESFLPQRVLTELAGAFMVARRGERRSGTSRGGQDLELLGERTAR
jgi:hypothetical protein